MLRKIKKGIGCVLTALLLIIVMLLNVACIRFNTVITRWWSGTVSKDNAEVYGYTAEETKADGALLTQQLEAEGAVLLKNDDQTLPLAKTDVSLIGYSSYDPMYIGCGSVAQGGDEDSYINYYQAFENDGYTCYQGMYDYYKDNAENRDNSGGGMFIMLGSDYNIYDEPLDTYQDTLKSASEATDTAIVVIGRTGGEGGDEPIDMADYYNGDAGKSYLELQDTELDMLHYCEENFDKVIVIINSSNPMELGFLEDSGIDAALWIGGPGSEGIQAVADIINGKVNPSGKLADIYAYDLTSAPSYYTCTAGTYNNYDAFDDSDNGYDNEVDGGAIWYNEGIYVGYRYYETAAEEGYIDYDTTVQYPFGYGLSYTSFDWELLDYEVGDVHGQITMDVKVTNTGDVAGKDVAEMYYTAPYYKGGIEKASKELGAYAKTKELAPGESETVTLQMEVDDLASYDYQNEGCYVADAGEYIFNLQTDSHTVKAGCQPITYTVDATRVYNDSGVGKRASDQVVAENQFDEVSAGDGNLGTSIPYVSRADFAGTMPAVTMNGQHITDMDISMGDEVIEKILNSEGGSDVDYDDDKDYQTISQVEVQTDQKNGLTVEDLKGNTDFDDPDWDLLVNQMSLDDMVKLISDSGYGTVAIKSIGKKITTDSDGPAGVSSSNLNYYGNEYTSGVVTASTWNMELSYNVGVNVGKECQVAGVSGWYAPGINLHRSPFGGRAGEYFSEDPLLTGTIASAEIQGVQSMGVYTYAKHFAGNDQDTNRGGMYTWMNEQSLRELYLRPFEYVVKEGQTQGLMEAYNRIGITECSVNKALNVKVAQKEWGFKGICLTDGYSVMIGSNKYNNPDLQLRAGTGMLLYTGGYGGMGGVSDITTKSDKGIEMLHDLCHKILYVYCNSIALDSVRSYAPTWIALLVVADVVLIGLLYLVIHFMVCPKKRKKKVRIAE